MAVVLNYCHRCRSMTVNLFSDHLRRLSSETPAGSQLGSTTRRFSTVLKTKAPKEEKADQQSSSTSKPSDPAVRFNLVRIQMIPEEQRQVLFKAPVAIPSSSTEKQCIAHLKAKGLWGTQPKPLSVPDVNLPALLGVNIEEHFRNIAIEQTQPYVDALDKLIARTAPPLPKKWAFTPGWTKYSTDGTTEGVPFPPDDALVFDVETCMTEGKYPTLATALSSTNWYSWCSRRLVDNTEEPLAPGGRLQLEHLIPLEASPGSSIDQVDWRPRVAVGHNVSFDRSYIVEQYFPQGSQLRFVDTMSMHIALAGFTTAQRAVHMKLNAARKKKPEEIAKQKAIAKKKASSKRDDDNSTQRWLEVGAMNNLEDVYQLHCSAKLPYDKQLQKVFVDGTLDQVREKFQPLMTYCGNDVRATHQLTQALIPKFREAMPHPVTFGGLLEMSSAYLPVNKNWETYISKSNAACDKLEQEMNNDLVKLARERLALRENDEYKNDLWMWDLDWSTQKVTTRTKSAELAGYPKWFRDMCDKVELDEKGEPVPGKVSLRMRVVPKLMQLTWDGWPLHHTMEHGWGWLEPAPLEAMTTVRSPKKKKKDEEEPKKAKTTKSQADAVFPLQKLIELATKLGRPVATVKEEVVKPLPEPESVLSDDDWDKISEMTPDQQQTFFAQQKDAPESTKVSRRFGRPEQPAPTIDDEELSKIFGEDLELQDFAARTQAAKQAKYITSKDKQKPVKEAEVNAYLDVVPGCIFRRLTHHNGIEFNVGNPLAKDFLQYFESGILKASFGSASDVIKHSKMVTYWHNNKDRVESQLVGHLEIEHLPDKIVKSPDYNDDLRLGAILPRLTLMGTVTRRAVEATWMTASNAKPGRIGSELKAMIQAPPGFNFVGADVDSQELWIAAILGDANWLQQHGCTAFGWMTLQGSKADGTDMHSKTAEQAGIGRDHAKILNYGRIYGAGREYTAVLLKNFSQDLTEAQANGKAHRIYSFAKGNRLYRLNALGKFLAEQCGLSPADTEQGIKYGAVKQIYELAYGKQFSEKDSKKEYGQIMSHMTEGSIWANGSESHMFNMLESVANSPQPRTPVLGCRISRCLMKENVEDDFLTSRVNWVVQSSAVDYLHLMLVCMKWLMRKYDIKGRFSLSIHDEVRYIVAEEDRYRAALALHITNLLTRAMFAYKVGICDLPQSVAYFSAVDVDKVIRKEVNLDCSTPSNAEGLEKEYGVPKGEALDVFQALEKCSGKLSV
ncbi:hypothetical protein RvY_13617 [Ramazzottius varieornatus]|uniref:Mitochondrial DNA polymerase catalytic subunit n=1 Tax=Ramazzottius varieornatus TaxID=947166 RepID=A0A1D1VQN1_RAMVA|nr:hypothetical protein RvY_13617 [Ramazzottius varieornatus]